jgi:hypothetical protein
MAEIAGYRGGNASYTAVMIPDAAHNWTIHPQTDAPFSHWHQAAGINDLVVAWVVHQTGRAPPRAALKLSRL